VEVEKGGATEVGEEEGIGGTAEDDIPTPKRLSSSFSIAENKGEKVLGGVKMTSSKDSSENGESILRFFSPNGERLEAISDGEVRSVRSKTCWKRELTGLTGSTLCGRKGVVGI